MPDSAIRSFGQWITDYNWPPVLDVSDTQSKTNTFHSILTQQIDKHFPTRRVSVTH